MSRLLRSIAKRKKYIVLIGLIIAFFVFSVMTLCFFEVNDVIICLWSVLYWAILGLLYLLNNRVLTMINKQREVFMPKSQIRNADYLIIGDMYSPNEIDYFDNTVVHIYSPQKTYKAAFEILKHTHSILKKDGTVIVTLNKKYENRDRFTVFDIAYFHEITINKFNLHKLLKISKLPIVISPILSLIMLINKKYDDYVDMEVENEIKQFCRERNLQMLYKVRK